LILSDYFPSFPPLKEREREREKEREKEKKIFSSPSIYFILDWSSNEENNWRPVWIDSDVGCKKPAIETHLKMRIMNNFVK